MIFVVLGTQKFQLNRLLMKLDALIEDDKIKDEVFAQIGSSDYIPKHYKYTRFLDRDSFEPMMENCEILITHSGVGTIVSGLNHGKPIIAYPRLAKYDEHVDDHQMEIAESFEQLNYVLLCKEGDDLNLVLEECRKHKFSEYKSQRKRMVSSIRDYLMEI